MVCRDLSGTEGTVKAQAADAVRALAATVAVALVSAARETGTYRNDANRQMLRIQSFLHTEE